MQFLKKYQNIHKCLYTTPPRISFFNFFEKKDTYVDPSRKKLRRTRMSPFIIPSLIVLSWVVLIKLWWGAEEVCRKQYETLNKQDASAYRTVLENNKDKRPIEVPEEYRSEYVKN